MARDEGADAAAPDVSGFGVGVAATAVRLGRAFSELVSGGADGATGWGEAADRV